MEQGLANGVHVDNEIQVRVLSGKIAEAAVREAQLEAAVQQLIAETQALSSRVMELEERLGGDASEGATAYDPMEHGPEPR